MKSSTQILYLSLFLILFNITTASAQINFGSFGDQYAQSIGSYATSVNILNTTSLVFGNGGIVLKNEGPVEIDLFDDQAIEIEIAGVQFLDIFLSIMADPFIQIAGCASETCKMPLEILAAYANKGSNTKSDATIIPIIENNGSAVLPIKYRGNVPPGPPPTPFYEGYTPPTDKAYLYIYGILTVGNNDSGDYAGSITITVNYD